MLPRDPIILVSYVNTQLRDHYNDLVTFCKEEDADETALRAALAEVGYQYDPAQKRFV